MKVPLEFLTKFDEDNLRKLNQLFLRIESAINAIEFGDGTTSENILCAFVKVVTANAASPIAFSVAHALGRTPIGVIPISVNLGTGGVDNFCDFSAIPGSAHDATKIYLNASASGASATFIVI